MTMEIGIATVVPQAKIAEITTSNEPTTEAMPLILPVAVSSVRPAGRVEVEEKEATTPAVTVAVLLKFAPAIDVKDALA